jgi:hypothetical protein
MVQLAGHKPGYATFALFSLLALILLPVAIPTQDVQFSAAYENDRSFYSLSFFKRALYDAAAYSAAAASDAASGVSASPQDSAIESTLSSWGEIAMQWNLKYPGAHASVGCGENFTLAECRPLLAFLPPSSGNSQGRLAIASRGGAVQIIIQNAATGRQYSGFIPPGTEFGG